MKYVLNSDIDDMMHQYVKYTPNAVEPISRLIYENKVHLFMKKLNELQETFNITITADCSEEHDGWTEASLVLYDNEYGCIGEIQEMEEESVEVDE